MEYFKITLRPKKAIVNKEYCEDLIWGSFNELRKTGQVYENFQVVRVTPCTSSCRVPMPLTSASAPPTRWRA